MRRNKENPSRYHLNQNSSAGSGLAFPATRNIAITTETPNYMNGAENLKASEAFKSPSTL